MGIFFKSKYGMAEVQEVFKNLPGVRGFIFPKYQPVAIHGDHIHPLNDLTVAPRARESYCSPPWKGVNTGRREAYRRPWESYHSPPWKEVNLLEGSHTVAPRARESTWWKGIMRRRGGPAGPEGITDSAATG